MIRPLSEVELTLETERLVLRPFRAEDVDIALHTLCDAEVMHYVADPLSPDEVHQRMGDAVRRGAGGRIGIWCLIRKTDGAKLGDAILLPVPIETDDTDWAQVTPEAYPPGPVEVGYVLAREAWGWGYATEACTRLLRFAFEQTDLDEVMAVTDPANLGSQAVLRKSGMRLAGLRRAYAEDDLPWFEITRADWQAQASNQ